MDVFRIIAIALVAIIIILVLEKTNKEYGVLVTILASVVILMFAINKLDEIVYLLNNLVTNAGINKEYLIVLLKVTGIAYIVELAKNICTDAGSSSLASKIEMTGKISVVVLTIPIITNVISVIINIV